jgi:hypothetical protein
MKQNLTTGTFQGVFWDIKRRNLFKYKLGHYHGNNHSILNLNLDEFFDKLRSIFGQFMSKLGQY